MAITQNGSTNIGPTHSEVTLGVSHAGHMAGQILVRTAQVGILNGPKTGRLYGNHQASAPGEYSANKSGALLKSVGYQMQGRYLTFYSRGCGHAGYQEKGTKFMAPRPNLGNAVRDADGAVKRVLGQIGMRTVATP